MTQKISKWILAVELVIFYIPVTLLFFVTTFGTLQGTIATFPWLLDWQKFILAEALSKIFFCIGLLSVFFAALRFFLEGTQGLFSLETKWWFFSSLSLLLVILSILALLPPPPGDTFKPDYVRSIFWPFKFGIPAFIPFVHVLLERYLRKVTMEEYDEIN